MKSAPRPKSLRARRPLRRLAQTLMSPASFDFWVSRLHPTWSWARPLARVVERRQESVDAVTLVLQPNRHWRGLVAGQHVNVSAEIDGTRVTRSYSPSATGRRIAITVKAIAGGKLSRYLCEQAKVGDVLDLGPPFGDMALPAAAREPLLFLAGGSGITPLMAMTRALAAQGMPVALSLVYWARTRAELCFVDELRALAATHSSLDVRFVLTRESAAHADESEGRIEDAALRALVPGFAQRHVYACGPGGFVERARELAGSHAASFQAEAFTPPVVTNEETGTVQVTLARSGKVLSVPRGQSLLTALEATGMKLASGCRMGICNTCSCGKRAGTTRQLHTGDVQHEPLSALRLCVNGAASDLVLDL